MVIILFYMIYLEVIFLNFNKYKIFKYEKKFIIRYIIDYYYDY